MNKKPLTLLLTAVLAASMYGCGDSSANNVPPVTYNQQQGEEHKGEKLNTHKEEIALTVVSEEVQKYTDAQGEPCATYLAELKNTSASTVELSDISIDLKDHNDRLFMIMTEIKSYPNIVAPGESAYIYTNILDSRTGIKASVGDIGAVQLHYDLVDPEPLRLPHVEVTGLSVKKVIGLPTVLGQIENKSSDDAVNLYFAAPIRDADGKLQNVIFAIFNLDAGEKMSFSERAYTGDPAADYSASTVSAFAYHPF